MNGSSVKRVAVLMSTYNGEKYLQEQMDSLLAQAGVEVSIFVRDDGSRDGTVTMVTAMAQQHPQIRLEAAANVGVIRSFFLLLQQVSEDFDYYAFCDQDDFWEADKLLRGVQALERQAQAGAAALYCSTFGFVDENLQPIGVSRADITPSFGNALVENIAAGCTSVLTPALRRLLVTELPERCAMHDWWVYLVASAFGTVVFDPETRIKYRQHGGNAVGGSASSVEMWRRRLQRFLGGKGRVILMQAEEFQRIYGVRLAPENQQLLTRFIAARASLAARLALLFSRTLRRQTVVDTWVIKLLILAGRF